MSTIKRALQTFLVEQLASKVGSRVFPIGNTPKTFAYPYVTYQRISSEHFRHMTGGSGKARMRYQIDVWGDTSAQAFQVAEMVRERLDNQRAVIEDVDIRYAFLESTFDEASPPGDGSAQASFRVSMDFMLMISESVTPIT